MEFNDNTNNSQTIKFEYAIHIDLLYKLAFILHSFYNCFQCQKTFNAKIMPPRMCMDVLQLNLQLEDKKNYCFKPKAQ